MDPVRVRIRPWSRSDIPSLARQANNRAISRNMRDAFPHPYGVEHADSWVRHTASLLPPRHFAIDLDGEMVGGVGIELSDDIDRISGELGYWVAEDHWGKGLATRAARLMTSYGFEELALHRIFAVPFTRNPASMRVLEKLGFRREGVFLECAVKDGELISEVVYAITAPEWTAGTRQDEY